MWAGSLSHEDPLNKGKATHSSIFAWRIPWTEEPGGLQSRGLQRVRHNWSDSARMYSTGTTTQYIITYMGKNLKRNRYLYMFNWITLLYTWKQHNTVNQLYFNNNNNNNEIVGKESAYNAGDTGDKGLIPGLGSFPGGENSKSFRYSCLKNSMDRRAWRAVVHGVSKSWTWLSTHGEHHSRSSLRLSFRVTQFNPSIIRMLFAVPWYSLCKETAKENKPPYADFFSFHFSSIHPSIIHPSPYQSILRC